MTAGHAALLAYAILSRLAYVLFVGWTLRREDRAGAYRRRFGSALAFRRFRRRAAFVMYHDAVAFTLLCVLTRNTWQSPFPSLVTIAVGATLAALGLATKAWAARTLGSRAYYWHNFFEPEAAVGPVSTGPYRFMSSPMYTVGYLQTYGLALLLESFTGLIAAGFSQATILIFYLLIEKPHFERLHGSS